MKKLPLFALVGLTLASPLSHATMTGQYDPYDRENAEDVVYAAWDSFNEHYAAGAGASTTYTYSGNGTGTLTGLSLTQNTAHISSTTATPQSAQGAGLLNGGDVYYSSTRAQNWTLTATTSIDITTMSFQIKTANVNLNNPIVLSSLYQPTLAGYGAGTQIQRRAVAGETLNGLQVYVIDYRWIGLDIEAGQTFNITFGVVGGNSGDFTRKPVDFVSLDAATVPEPSTYALMALGLGLVAWKVRRRFATQA